MNIYKSTLNSMSETKTLASHIKALGKIKCEAEDEELILNITLVIDQLQIAHITSKNKSTPISLDRASDRKLIKLRGYCKAVIKSTKPEWQVMAEKNGWIPPKP